MESGRTLGNMRLERWLGSHEVVRDECYVGTEAQGRFEPGRDRGVGNETVTRGSSPCVSL